MSAYDHATHTPNQASAPAGRKGSLDHVRSDRRAAVVAALAVAAAAGLVAAWLTPRGPATTAEALAWMAGGLLVGLACGFLLRSRWSLLLAPVVFAVGFELGRSGSTGPTVDGIQLGSTYGLIAFVVGRGVTYLLGLTPMLLGAALGAHLAARRAGSTRGRLGRIGWLACGVAAVVLVGLAWLIARPPSTAPIVGADLEPVAGSIAELTSVTLGGHEQALMIRGRSADAPVLLHLAGGPGGTDIGAMRDDTGLEQHFVVVTWDQRGSGKSYAALDPVATLTPAQMVADTIELTEYLRQRFDEERIFLHGQSWGSTLGVLAAQARPDLYHALVGSGQMVSQRETDIMFWEDTLAWAERVGDEALATQLRQLGPPPYDELYAYEPALSHEHDWNPYPELDLSKEMPANLFVPENDLLDRINGLRAFLDTFAVLYPQLQDVDFRRDVPRLEVPFVMIVGAHEARGRAVLADEWFDMLEAPSKERIVFEGAGHRPTFEQPARFVEVMSRLAQEQLGPGPRA